MQLCTPSKKRLLGTKVKVIAWVELARMPKKMCIKSFLALFDCKWTDVLQIGDSTVCECPCTMSQNADGNLEDNLDKGAFKGAVGYVWDSQFSSEIKSLSFGIIQTGFDPQINQSLTLWLWPNWVSSQFLPPWSGYPVHGIVRKNALWKACCIISTW